MKAGIAAGAAASLWMAAAAHADRIAHDDGAQVRAAVAGLYRALAARDTAGLAVYLPVEGFSEFSPPEGALKTLDLDYFRHAFDAGVRVDLHVEGEQVRIREGQAIVTGYRLGTITLPQAQPLAVRDCMTMVWSRENTAWMLRHVHISACAAP
ncbi:MAG TPA: nuclear transport factor 2 family protein [Steroidobacteraceae bacterium]